MPILATLSNLFGIEGLIILAFGLLIFRRHLPVGVQKLWHRFDPSERLLRQIMLFLFVATLVVGPSIDGLIILAVGLLIFRRHLPVGARDIVYVFDPRETPLPLIGLILIVAALLALALTGRVQQ